MQQTVITGYRLIPYLTGYYIVPLEAPVFPPGTRIRIEIPITNQSIVDVRVRLRVFVYQGAIAPVRGPLLQEWTTPEQTIPAGETVSFAVERTTEETRFPLFLPGELPRRDVGVIVQYYDEFEETWKDGPSEEWDDVYYVRLEYVFVIGRPTVTAVE